MTTTNTMDTLREHLFGVLQGVKDGKIEVDRAKVVCEISQTIINTAKAESDYAKATGMAVASSLIEIKSPAPAAKRPELVPTGDADTERRLTSTGVLERTGNVTRHRLK